MEFPGDLQEATPVAEKSGSESPPTISLPWVEKKKAAYRNVTDSSGVSPQ